MESPNLVSVVIPALNEEEGIKSTISSISKLKIHELGYDLEIVVVDGNSTDSTRKLAEEMGARVILQTEKGYGSAYKIGLRAARGDLIVTMDADNTYPVDIIPECITQLMTKDLDFITVNRFAKMDKDAMSFAHKIGNKILSIALSSLYSFKIRDSQSGMWLMKRSFVDRIRLNSNNMSMSEEIKIIAFKFFKSLEIDGQYNKRMGTAKLNTLYHGWGNFKYLFTFRQLLKCAVVTELPVEILPQTK